MGLDQWVRWQVQVGSLCLEHAFHLVPRAFNLPPPSPAFRASWRHPPPPPPPPVPPQGVAATSCLALTLLL